MSTTGPDRLGFARTRWSLVLAAGRGADPVARAALSELCAAYWMPLYHYVRRRGHERATAEDLVQGFFLRLLERDDFATLDAERGRFRAFLLTALKHYLADEHDRRTAEKRGGGRLPIARDFERADSKWRLEPATDATPDKAYERAFAEELLARALQHVEADYAARGEARAFGVLVATLTAPGEVPYRALADELGATEGAVKVAAHRLRERWRIALREEVARLVDDPAEVDEELAALFAALAG
ncbi:MAG: sigma-70 family RNA polymerase sigma factor [Planctomycetes bacterium]|nr:sigma-70 family RNA polymerase sigma factor [Planctomycetota bacterium]